MSALSGNPVSTVRLPAAAAVAAAVAAVAVAVAVAAVAAVAAVTASNHKDLPFAVLYRYFITCRTCHRQIPAYVRK